MTSLPTRPDPDALLARVERELGKMRRGQLKIFFGMAAGVGKTFAMLQAARERRAEGIDVVVGLVETHGRKETAVLLDGLEVLPAQTIDYRGAVLREFDLDSALKRKPAILLVDELAHTNAPGCRHPKRWQDIEELLEAGIHVYTALNVQHLESLNDDVGQFAGIRVWETVPDTVFEQADEIELIDLPPDELLTRLREGKVYLPEQAQRAQENFFRKGNLIALRELALRQTTHRVDAQMQLYREDHAIHEVWQVGERILVCIPPAPMAERLIRAGKRLAAGLRSEWIVAYVETPALQRLPAERRDAVPRMLSLAEQLGAETVTLTSSDMSRGIIDFALERNVTRIVMGKPGRRGWRRWLQGSVVDTVISEAHNISVHLLGSPRGTNPESGESSPLFRKAPLPGLRAQQPDLKVLYRGYVWGLAVIAVCSLIARGLFGRFELTNLAMVYLLGVVFAAMRLGQGPAILVSILGVAVFDFLFVPPYFSFAVSDSQYLLTFVAMLTVALTTSYLMTNVRYQARIAAHRERRATILYAMGRELSACRDEEDVAKVAVRHIHAEFGGSNAILFPDDTGRLAHPAGVPLDESLRGCDLAVAQWVHDHNEVAGKGTHTLAGANAVYFPLASMERVLGVMVVRPLNLRRIYLPEQKKLLDSFLDQITQAIERTRLAEQAKAASVQMEAERLRNSLLSAISHDLRTPLATIVGSASAVVEGHGQLTPQDRLELEKAILNEAVRMSNLINNILNMARLDVGVVKLNRQWHTLEDIVGTVLTRLAKPLEGRAVKLPPLGGLALVYVDSVMIEQVLVNLLENAVRYTPPESPIDIGVERTPFAVTISVADRGPGIPAGEEKLIFEKFHRARLESAQSGVGLGLAICRAIVEVHGGWISARNRGTGGAEFTFGLPQEQPPPVTMPEDQDQSEQP